MRQAEELGHMNSSVAPVSLTKGVINSVVENSRYLFTEDDVRKVVGSSYTAKHVLIIIRTILGNGGLEDQTGHTAQMELD